MRDWSSDVCSSDLTARAAVLQREIGCGSGKNAIVAEGNPAGMGIAAEDQSARTDPRQFGGANFEAGSRRCYCAIDQDRYCVSRRQRRAIGGDSTRYKNNASRTLDRSVGTDIDAIGCSDRRSVEDDIASLTGAADDGRAMATEVDGR